MIGHDPDDELRNVVEASRAKSQAFFAQLQADARRPHCGELVRGIYETLVKRAQEQGLFTPEPGATP